MAGIQTKCTDGCMPCPVSCGQLERPLPTTTRGEIQTFHDFHPKLFCSKAASKLARVLMGTHIGTPAFVETRAHHPPSPLPSEQPTSTVLTPWGQAHRKLAPHLPLHTPKPWGGVPKRRGSWWARRISSPQQALLQLPRPCPTAPAKVARSEGWDTRHDGTVLSAEGNKELLDTALCTV